MAVSTFYGIHGFPVTRLFSPDGYSHFRTSRL